MIEKFFYTDTITLVKDQLNNAASLNSSEVYHFNELGVKKRCKFRPNFPIVIQSVGISTGHGIVNENTENSVTVFVTGAEPIITQLVPFFPSEIAVGKNTILPDIGVSEYDINLNGRLGVSMVNLPDVLDSTQLKVTVFFTAELDKNAFVEVA